MTENNASIASWVKKYTVGNYVIAPLAREHFSQIRVWRNAQIDILRQDKPLTEEEQTCYYETRVNKLYQLEKPDQMLFGMFLKTQLIAYGGLVHIDWSSERAELSFLNHMAYNVNLENYTDTLSAFIAFIKQFSFDEIGLNRIYTETYDLRPAHINILEYNGFQREGQLREHVKIGASFVNSLFHGITKEDYYAL